MQKKSLHFNVRLALKQFKRYTRKRNKLIESGNVLNSKINFLNKRIEKLKMFLVDVFKRTKLATAAGALALTLSSNSAQAQSFAAPVTNPFGLTDVVSFSAPALVDLDNDGDLDLMSGNTDTDDFIYFQNTGTASAPAFATAVANPFGLTGGLSYATPTFGDMDGDGDFDMMVGSNDGYGDIYYFQNTGTASAPAFAAGISNPFGITIPVGTYSGYYGTYTYGIAAYSDPDLVDLDNDGDLDMIVGNDDNGELYYYQNSGTSTAPAFMPFTILIGSWDNGITPSAVDFDGDGDFDLFMGEGTGGVYYSTNTGTASAPTFSTPTLGAFPGLTIAGGAYSNVHVDDLNSDGLVDILVGDENGDFHYFQQNCTAPDVTTSLTGVTLSANFTGADSYQWVTCPGFSAATGTSTNQTYTATANGDYAVIISNNGCIDTSACVSVTTVGVEDILENNKLIVFPNPNNGSFTIQSTVASGFVISNSVGQVVQTITLDNSNNYTLQVSDLSAGVYYINSTGAKAVTRYKIVVTK